MGRMSGRRAIEVRGFKWPRRPTAVAMVCLLGEDEFGRWLGVTRGDPWWAADRSRSGVFETSLVKVVPNGTFWTACFHPVDLVVDVDIVLPVRWVDDALEEVDLELDILRGTWRSTGAGALAKSAPPRIARGIAPTANQPAMGRTSSRWLSHTRAPLPTSRATLRIGTASRTPTAQTSAGRSSTAPPKPSTLPGCRPPAPSARRGRWRPYPRCSYDSGGFLAAMMRARARRCWSVTLACVRLPGPEDGPAEVQHGACARQEHRRADAFSGTHPARAPHQRAHLRRNRTPTSR